MLLDRSFHPYYEASNSAHDQVQIYSIQHWEAGKLQIDSHCCHVYFQLFIIIFLLLIYGHYPYIMLFKLLIHMFIVR